MKACGLSEDTAIMNETEFYVSHECLLMEYERALTRQDSTTGLWCVLARCHRLCARMRLPGDGPAHASGCQGRCRSDGWPSYALFSAQLVCRFCTAVSTHSPAEVRCRYDCSGHFLWVGERTRQLDGAHLEFLRGIGNPLGVKVGLKRLSTRRRAQC